jgi:hypothetical protein
VQEELQEMMIGRSDERVNPGRATAAEGRSIVVVSFAEPIWVSGHRAASTGRTHDRRRTVHQILQKIFLRFRGRPHMRVGPFIIARRYI